LSHRTNVFGLDLPQFERMLAQPLREHLLAFTDGRQDLAKGNASAPAFAVFGDWSNAEGNSQVYLEPGGRIRHWSAGKSRIVSRESLVDVPELSLRTLDYIQSTSDLAYRFLMELLADFQAYPFVKWLVPRTKRQWIDHLMEAFAYWYGPESEDLKAVEELFGQFDARHPSKRTSLPIPRRETSLLHIGCWTADDTRLAIVYLKDLLDLGGEPPHRQTQWMPTGHKRLWIREGFSEPTPDEHEEWSNVRTIIDRFLSLDEFPQPAVVGFYDP
jgi:hypothetical protein